MVRSAILLGTLLAMAVAASSATAANVLSQQKASITYTPDASAPVTSPQPVALALRTWFDDITADLSREVQFATVNGSFYLPAEIALNLAAFPTCSQETVFQDETQCPAGSQIGSGTTFIQGIGLDEDVALKLFNLPQGQTTLLATGQTPLIIREVAHGTLEQLTDPTYKYKLTLATPRNLQSPAPGVISAFKDFQLTLPIQSVTSNGVPIPLVANTGCTGFRYVAEYTVSFDATIDSSQTVESPPPCRAVPPTPPPAPVPPPPPAAAVSKLKLAGSSFRAARRGGSVGTKGMQVSYSLPAAGTVTFRVLRRTPGRLARTCRTKTPRKAGPRCTLETALKGGFQHAGEAGTNTFRFTGRLAGRSLRRGDYSLSAQGPAGPERRVPFRITGLAAR